jgi:electron transport complex protein RnfB
MTTSDAYEALAEKLGFPGSALLHSILEDLMTPKEAAMAEALPATVAEIAEKVGVSEAEAREGLDNLFFKGVVYPRGDFNNRDYYRFTRSIMQMHDATLGSSKIDIHRDRDFCQKWHDFSKQEMYPYWSALIKDATARRSRIVPARKSLEGLSDVLPCEDYHELLRAQEVIAVVPCSCRTRSAAAGEPCAHSDETATWHCLQFGRGAEYVIARGCGKELTVEEAIDVCDKIEDDGLLHRWANKTGMTGVNTSCNCCRDCCEELVSQELAGIPVGSRWEKSRYDAYVADLESCNGCGDCVERCQFDAVTLYQDAAGDTKAAIEAEKCFGCGACVVSCPFESLRMRAVRPPEHIPEVVPGTGAL